MRLVGRIALALIASAASTVATAGECRVQNASQRGQWKFIRAYDVTDNIVVLRQPINGGDSKPVTVKGASVRVEYKLAGDKHYHPAHVAACEGGNVVRI
jgi:hypothetical protein